MFLFIVLSVGVVQSKARMVAIRDVLHSKPSGCHNLKSGNIININMIIIMTPYWCDDRMRFDDVW